MKRFLFNLETLLKYREDLEQRERDELSRLLHKLQLELRRRDVLESRRQVIAEELALMQAGEASHGELTWFYLYLDRLRNEIAESEKCLAQLEAGIKTQRGSLTEASKKRQTLTLMKAKKEKEYIVELERQQQKDIDEMIVARFTRERS